MNTRNRRTVVARLAAGTLATGALAACDSGGPGAADRPAQTAPPVTVSFSSQGNPQEFQMFDRILDAFEQAQARVKVDRRYDTSLTWEKVHALILAEEAADVQRTNDDDIFALTAGNGIRSLEAYVKRDLKTADYYDSAWKSRVGPGDEIAAATVGSSPLVVFYNAEHFRQINVTPPTDWKSTWSFDQFVDALRRLTDLHRRQGAGDRWAYADESWFIQPLMWNNGFRPYTADETKATFLTPAAVEIAGLYQDWFCKAGYAQPIPAPPGDNPSRAFREGRLSIWLGQTSFAATLPADLDWEVAPVFKGKVEATTENSERCWTIPRHSKQPEAAWELAKWLHQKTAQEEFARIDYAVPMLKSVAEGPVFNDPARKPKHRNVWYQGVANDVPTLNNPMGDFYQAWFSRTTDDLRSCKQSPQEFLREREALANQKIQETGWNKKTNYVKGWKLQR
jgi:multiple sugar transport system substrate-binding protein